MFLGVWLYMGGICCSECVSLGVSMGLVVYFVLSVFLCIRWCMCVTLSVCCVLQPCLEPGRAQAFSSPTFLCFFVLCATKNICVFHDS